MVPLEEHRLPHRWTWLYVHVFPPVLLPRMWYRSVPQLFRKDRPHIRRPFSGRKGLVFTCAVVLLSLSGHIGQSVTGEAEPVGGTRACVRVRARVRVYM